MCFVRLTVHLPWAAAEGRKVMLWNCKISRVSLMMSKWCCYVLNGVFKSLSRWRNKNFRSSADWGRAVKISHFAEISLQIEQYDRWNSILEFFSGLEVEKCDDVLVATLSVGKDQLAGLFQRTFWSEAWDSSWISEIRRSTEKLCRFNTSSTGAKILSQRHFRDETVLHRLVQLRGISVLWNLIELLLTNLGLIRWSIEFIVRINCAFFGREGEAVSLDLMAIVEVFV